VRASELETQTISIQIEYEGGGDVSRKHPSRIDILVFHFCYEAESAVRAVVLPEVLSMNPKTPLAIETATFRPSCISRNMVGVLVVLGEKSSARISSIDWENNRDDIFIYVSVLLCENCF
jgi:hypothetical protein